LIKNTVFLRPHVAPRDSMPCIESQANRVGQGPKSRRWPQVIPDRHLAKSDPIDTTSVGGRLAMPIIGAPADQVAATVGNRKHEWNDIDISFKCRHVHKS
jgi:hypothetical protein